MIKNLLRMEPKNNIFEQNRKKGKEVSLQKNCNPWFLSIFLSTSTFTLWQQKSEAAALCRNSIHEQIESGWLQSFLLAAATLSRLSPSRLALTTVNILSNNSNLNYWQHKHNWTYFWLFYQNILEWWVPQSMRFWVIGIKPGMAGLEVLHMCNAVRPNPGPRTIQSWINCNNFNATTKHNTPFVAWILAWHLSV